MRLYLSTLIAWRFLHAALHKKNIRMVLLSALVSMALATGALVFIDAISTGFQKATVQGLQGINPDIIMYTKDGALAVDAINMVLREQFPTIRATSAYSNTQGLIQADTKQNPPTAAFIKGVDATQEARVTALHNMYQPNNQYIDFLAACAQDRIVLGATLARLLKVTMNESVSLMIPSFDEKGNSTLHTIHARVSGVVKTGIEDLDATLVVADYHLFDAIDGVTLNHLGIQLIDGAHSASVIAALQKRMPGLTIYAWTDLYPGMLDALKLEQYAFTLILTILIVIASITIVASISMLIITKRQEIFILHIMGMDMRAIKKIFYRIALVTTAASATVGIACAWIIGTVIERYQLIALPDAYYISYLPVCLHFARTVMIWCIAVSIGLLAAYYATRLISDTDVMQTIKREE